MKKRSRLQNSALHALCTSSSQMGVFILFMRTSCFYSIFNPIFKKSLQDSSPDGDDLKTRKPPPPWVYSHKIIVLFSKISFFTIENPTHTHVRGTVHTLSTHSIGEILDCSATTSTSSQDFILLCSSIEYPMRP